MEEVNGILVMALLVIIFAVDNASSSHTDNQKNDFLVLGKGPTYEINVRFGIAEK